MQAEKHLKGLLLYLAPFINISRKGRSVFLLALRLLGLVNTFFLLKLLYVCIHACVVCVGVPKKPEQGIGSLGAGVTDSCELSDVGAEN